MSTEMLHITPTTEQRAKMAYAYIRQSSLMQVTRHAESTDLQYALVERAIALGWPRERVELIDEDLGKSGAQAEARGGFQRLLAEISLRESAWCSALMPPAWPATIAIGINCSRSARSLAPSLPTANGSTTLDCTTTDYCWGYQA